MLLCRSFGKGRSHQLTPAYRVGADGNFAAPLIRHSGEQGGHLRLVFTVEPDDPVAEGRKLHCSLELSSHCMPLLLQEVGDACGRFDSITQSTKNELCSRYVSIANKEWTLQQICWHHQLNKKWTLQQICQHH